MSERIEDKLLRLRSQKLFSARYLKFGPLNFLKNETFDNMN